MKFYSKIIILLILFLILQVLAFCSDNTPHQTYIPQIILNEPWGQKPGEFGIDDPYARNPKAIGQGPVMGPSTFTVAPNGDIYIVDMFNYRVQRFTQDGAFVSSFSLLETRSAGGEDISVDANGNIYLLYLGPAVVRKFDSNGNLLKIIFMFNHEDEDAEGMNTGGGPTKIFCDKSGRLFLQYRSEKYRDFRIFQFGTDVTDFTPEQQKATLRRGFAGGSGIILKKEQIFQYIDGKMFTVDNSNKAIRGYNFSGTYSFLDVDGSGNAYMTYYNMDTDIYSIKKQTPDGKIICTFEWKFTNYAHHNLNKPLIVDAQGNVYVFDSTKEGITITKWSPVGTGK
ncbi:MAG: hypothetical protein MUO78_04925 [candidate division Zixibacteria bacterium]|nr:hypothetical protein [candidate division Zixibacteria bacterium]